MSLSFFKGQVHGGHAAGLTMLAADERAAEARCARNDLTARSRSPRYAYSGGLHDRWHYGTLECT